MKSGERMVNCMNVLDDEDDADSDVAGKGIKKFARHLQSFKFTAYRFAHICGWADELMEATQAV